MLQTRGEAIEIRGVPFIKPERGRRWPRLDSFINSEERVTNLLANDLPNKPPKQP